MSDACSTPIPLSDLYAYRRAELDAAGEAALEAHFFSCATCAERLAWLERLEAGVALAMRQGLFDVFVRPETVDRLEREGCVVRKYDLQAGQSVNCTIAPDDDMTVVTLHGPRRPDAPVRLLVELLDHASGQRMNEERPAFQDSASGDVKIRLAGVSQKSLGHVRVTLNLRFGDGPDAELAGPYELNHTPWGSTGG
jgi:hypothetical protein